MPINYTLTLTDWQARYLAALLDAKRRAGVLAVHTWHFEELGKRIDAELDALGAGRWDFRRED